MASLPKSKEREREKNNQQHNLTCHALLILTGTLFEQKHRRNGLRGRSRGEVGGGNGKTGGRGNCGQDVKIK